MAVAGEWGVKMIAQLQMKLFAGEKMVNYT